MDILSEVLKVVKLEGALFFNAEFSAPWSIKSAKGKEMAPYLAPHAEHLIVYHFLRGNIQPRLQARSLLPSGTVLPPAPDA
jgi:hypothetical protein